MKKHYNPKLKRDLVELFAGDFYATPEQDIALGTLLGSCISVCIRDKTTGIVGMNHFMLPGSVRSDDIIFSEDARYGIHAMELMINEMIKLGAKRNTLEAKVFGGGRVLDSNLNNVAQSNIEFAEVFLQMEQIPVIAKDVGGNHGRKLFFFPDTFTIYLKRIEYNKTLESAVVREKKFLEWMRNQRKRESDLVLFDKNGSNGKRN